jgi:transcriptional regulator with XRE-family HTH domain
MIDGFGDETATFGDRRAAAREAAALSRVELAFRLGVGERTVATCEDDRAEPRANRLQMLAGMLNVTLMWLLIGRGEGAQPPGEERSAVPVEIDAVLTDLILMRAEMGRMAERVVTTVRRRRLGAREAA